MFYCAINKMLRMDSSYLAISILLLLLFIGWKYYLVLLVMSRFFFHFHHQSLPSSSSLSFYFQINKSFYPKWQCDSNGNNKLKKKNRKFLLILYFTEIDGKYNFDWIGFCLFSFNQILEKFSVSQRCWYINHKKNATLMQKTRLKVRKKSLELIDMIWLWLMKLERNRELLNFSWMILVWLKWYRIVKIYLLCYIEVDILNNQECLFYLFTYYCFSFCFNHFKKIAFSRRILCVSTCIFILMCAVRTINNKKKFTITISIKKNSVEKYLNEKYWLRQKSYLQNKMAQ